MVMVIGRWSVDGQWSMVGLWETLTINLRSPEDGQVTRVLEAQTVKWLRISID